MENEKAKTALKSLTWVIENELIGDKWNDLKQAMINMENEQMLNMFVAGWKASSLDFNPSNSDLSQGQIEHRLKELFTKMYSENFEA